MEGDREEKVTFSIDCTPAQLAGFLKSAVWHASKSVELEDAIARSLDVMRKNGEESPQVWTPYAELYPGPNIAVTYQGNGKGGHYVVTVDRGHDPENGTRGNQEVTDELIKIIKKCESKYPYR